MRLTLWSSEFDDCLRLCLELAKEENIQELNHVLMSKLKTSICETNGEALDKFHEVKGYLNHRIRHIDEPNYSPGMERPCDGIAVWQASTEMQWRLTVTLSKFTDLQTRYQAEAKNRHATWDTLLKALHGLACDYIRRAVSRATQRARGLTRPTGAKTAT